MILDLTLFVTSLETEKAKKCTTLQEIPTKSMFQGVCQNGGFRTDTRVETSTEPLVAVRIGALYRYELVYQLE